MRDRSMVIGVLLASVMALSPMLSMSASAQSPEPVATSGTATASPQPAPSGDADLGVTITSSDPAPAVDSDFQVTAAVVNHGPQAATNSELILNFGPGIGYLSAGSSDPTDSCTLQTYSDPQPADGGTEPGSYPYYEGAQVTCMLGELSPDASETVTFNFRRTASQASSIGAGIYSDQADQNYENNYSNVDLGPDRSNPAEVSISLTGPDRARVGSTFELSISARNAGPSTATGTTILGDVPGGLEVLSIEGPDCSITASGTSQEPVRPDPYNYFQSFRCEVGSMPAGSTELVKLSVKRTLPDEVYVNAYIQVTNYQDNSENDYGYYQLGPDTSDPADLAITMSAPTGPAVDSTFDYSIVVNNKGPNTARDVLVTDILPEGVRFESVQSADGTCAYSAGEPGPDGEPKPDPRPLPAEDQSSSPSYYNQEVRCDLASIGSGQRARIVITVTRTSPWDQWSSAWVSSSTYDPDKENNYASAAIAADPSVTSDVRLTMSGPSATPLVGDEFDYAFSVTNQGPAEALEVYLDSYLPEGLQLLSVKTSDPSLTCDGASNGGDPVAQGDGGSSTYPGYSNNYVACWMDRLPVGASRTVTVTVSRRKAYELWLSSSIYSRNFDPVYEDNFAELAIGPDKSNPADLSVRLDTIGRPAVDTNFKVAGTISNGGPSTATEVTTTISLPGGAEYVSADIQGGSCELSYGDYPVVYAEDGASEDRPYYGYGSVICSITQLASGSSADFSVTATRRSPYEDWASAWVGSANWDPQNDNDQAGVALEGKRYPGQCYYGPPPQESPDCAEGTVCGSKGSDDIVVGDCAVASGAGADDVAMEAGASSTGSNVRSGKGPDNVVVNITGVSEKRRRFEVHAGRGNDSITISAAPGSGNATVVVFGGRGDDSITVDTALASRSVRVIVRGGKGRDEIRVPGLQRGAPGVRVDAGGGNDTVFGGSGPDRIFGGAGNDLLDGRGANDRIDGGSGTNQCRGGPGRDTVINC